MNLIVVACLAVCLAASAAVAGVASAGRKVEVVAHRGESFDAPENTAAAFDLAWSRGAEAVEIDVHLTKDGQLICSHDADTRRTAGVPGAIREQTADALRKLDVGAWKGPQFKGEPMPMLDEVLAKVPPGDGRRLFIEVKVGPEAVPELARCLERAKLPAAKTVVIAFDINVIREAKRQLPPGVKAYWLVSQKQDKQTKQWAPAGADMIANAKAVNADGLDVRAVEPVDAAFVKAAHDAGLELHVWTVDDPAKAKALVAAGVDGITTNRSAWLREQLAK